MTGGEPKQDNEEADPDRKELAAELEALDRKISKAEALGMEELADRIDELKQKRDAKRAQLHQLRPLKLQIRIATSARDEASKLVDNLKQEEEQLTQLLMANKRASEQAAVQLEQAQSKLEALRTKERDQCSAQIGYTAHAEETENPSPLEWAVRFAAALPPDQRESFNQWAEAAHIDVGCYQHGASMEEDHDEDGDEDLFHMDTRGQEPEEAPPPKMNRAMAAFGSRRQPSPPQQAEAASAEQQRPAPLQQPQALTASMDAEGFTAMGPGRAKHRTQPYEKVSQGAPSRA